jgi:DNA-binding MarR family transcriptional regulator
MREADTNAVMCRALDVIADELGRTVPVRLVRVLLHVGGQTDDSLTDIAKAIGISASTASRDLMNLGDHDRRGEAGFKLVRQCPHPFIFQNKYELTDRGTRFLDRLTEALTH